MIIKNILREELNNSLKMKDRYNDELQKLPKGSLQKKKIKGKDYYYRVYRDRNGKVVLEYIGKYDDISGEDVKRWEGIKERRSMLRSSISQLNRQIKFLQKVLNGKDQV